MHTFGIHIGRLGEFSGNPEQKEREWGTYTLCDSRAEYVFERFAIRSKQSLSITAPEGREITLFIEEGELRTPLRLLQPRSVFQLYSRDSVVLETSTDCCVYAFQGVSRPGKEGVFEKTFEVREKYWGTIESMVNRSYAGKRLFFRKGKHTSLEYHCRKLESYYVHSGILFVRLRAGRGEDRFFEFGPGETLFLPPGLMHQKGGKTDTIFMEISTHDEDSDSFLVEDGLKVPMPSLVSTLPS